MRRFKSLSFRINCLLIILIICFNEFLIYDIYKMGWNRMECTNGDLN